MRFNLYSSYQPTGDQPQAIEKLVEGIEAGFKHQVLLGVTGSGKTFTIANVIKRLQIPTLVISHNKTLAAQLYQEFRDFFPENAVSYFVSYYDYYQPEAYIPQTDTYIEKETDINELIDKLRLEATANIMTRRDVIVVASVSCIYNIGSPVEYGNFVLELNTNRHYQTNELLRRLVELQYERNDYKFIRGTFRVRGEIIDIFPAYMDCGIRLQFRSENLEKIQKIDPVAGTVTEELEGLVIYPAKHYMVDTSSLSEIFAEIRKDLKERVKFFEAKGKLLEAKRLEKRVNYDLEMIEQVGYVNGIENYSRYFDGRRPGDPPYSLFDYFHHAYQDNFLVVIDESHMTIPQIEGMYNGDYARKKTLVDFGFRLPAAFDNRPLKFNEFLNRVPQAIYVSATPGQWEIQKAKEEAARHPKKPHSGVVEQLLRPTGIPDPEIEIKPVKGQISDLISEAEARIKKGQRVLVTTLTKRMAEDLSVYLQEKGMQVHYLHSEIDTLDRSDILDALRQGQYDVLVGINLLREGLDLPEVSLIAILDADKEGFLRSETSLIQVMGRAARHPEGKVIMYADNITGSMSRAIAEVERRRAIQLEYNKKHHIKPRPVQKPIRAKLVDREITSEPVIYGVERNIIENVGALKIDSLTPKEKREWAKRLKKAMQAAAKDLNFELAALLRDRARELEASL